MAAAGDEQGVLAAVFSRAFIFGSSDAGVTLKYSFAGLGKDFFTAAACNSTAVTTTTAAVASEHATNSNDAAAAAPSTCATFDKSVESAAFTISEATLSQLADTRCLIELLQGEHIIGTAKLALSSGLQGASETPLTVELLDNIGSTVGTLDALLTCNDFLSDYCVGSSLLTINGASISALPPQWQLSHPDLNGLEGSKLFLTHKSTALECIFQSHMMPCFKIQIQPYSACIEVCASTVYVISCLPIRPVYVYMIYLFLTSTYRRCTKNFDESAHALHMPLNRCLGG
jgi:hypothetical protein